ncbi:flagellar assembly protein FliW [Rummeliibacillus pycnus]|uniref:flagellar assembly protein FliW n=1 Tax=Rummeliibacillus pycnus TaxID=101070 RepID=UPI0037C6FDA5
MKPMKIDTKFLGQVVVTPEQLYSFEEGIPGFPEEKHFALIPFGKDTPFMILQSTKVTQVSFVLAFPYTFKVDYTFDLSKQDVEALKIEKQEDILTYAIVTLKDTLPKSTINLLAPIVINTKTNQGRQIVLNANNQELLHYPLHPVKEGVK